MRKLPIDLKLTLSGEQIGALQAKLNINEVRDRLNVIDCSNAKGDILPELLLENRTKIIADIVKRLGQLSEFQVGYITALLEFTEANDGCEQPSSWLPSAISGRWQ